MFYVCTYVSCPGFNWFWAPTVSNLVIDQTAVSIIILFSFSATVARVWGPLFKNQLHNMSFAFLLLIMKRFFSNLVFSSFSKCPYLKNHAKVFSWALLTFALCVSASHDRCTPYRICSHLISFAVSTPAGTAQERP